MNKILKRKTDSLCIRDNLAWGGLIQLWQLFYDSLQICKDFKRSGDCNRKIHAIPCESKMYLCLMHCKIETKCLIPGSINIFFSNFWSQCCIWSTASNGVACLPTVWEKHVNIIIPRIRFISSCSSHFCQNFSGIVDSLCACALSLVGTDTYCVKIKCGTGFSQWNKKHWRWENCASTVSGN